MRKSGFFSWLPAVLLVIASALAARVPALAQGQSTQEAAPAAAKTDPGDKDSSASQTLDLTEEVVRDILSHLQRGLEAHNLPQVSSIFDQQATGNYSDIRNQLQAFFQHYDAIQFRYQVLQVMAERDHGFATADIDMDASPADDSQVPIRRTLQMRFQMKLTAKGWKVTGFKPSDFFAQ